MRSSPLTVGKILANKQQLSETDHREDDFPAIPQGLLDALDRLFPLSMPDIGASEREIWYRYGQVSVVDHLKQRKEIELGHVQPERD